MKSFVLISLVLIILAILAAAFVARNRKSGGGNAEGPWPFYAKKPLTPPEQVLYHRLVRALPEHIVLAQVQVSRILGVKKGFNFNEWNNRINRLSYDFVVCSKDAAVLLAIELDDKSHEKIERVSTDAKKEKATVAANVTLVRWHVKALPDESTIQAAVRAAA